jgi:hypothetical protein
MHLQISLHSFLATFTDNPFLYFLPCLSGSSKLRVL